VVINKCDDETKNLRLDEKGLRREYPSIVAFVRTSCNDDRDAAAKIAALRELIAGTLADDERLKHVRDGIPESWLRVKEAVAGLAREESVLKVPDFERLCAEPGEGNGDAIADHDTQWALLRLLHDLGVVVAHGLERDARAALRDITLLDPNWLTDAIYTLLNSRAILDQGGEFAREQMRELLDANCYPEKWHEFILGMMEDPDVGLCFELSGTDHQRYLIPEALPTNEPDYEVWPADSLRFRYKYELLPPGLIPRFIVESHRNTAENPTRWKTGVVLKAADCPVWVRGDRDKGRIDILVAGPAGRRRAALNVVLNDLEAVHGRNREIGAEGRVPLRDAPEVDVSYRHLLKLEELYGADYEFLPEGAERAYKVNELLDGVRRERSTELEVDGDSRGPKIVAGDRAQITFVGGDVRSSGGETQVGTRGGEGATGSVITSWPMFSVACGIGAIVVAIVLWLIPSNEWRAIVGGLLGLGLAVTAVVLTFNPKFFYRRQLAYVISGGLLVNALGGMVDLFVLSKWAVGSFRWDSMTSGWFFVAWAAVVWGLVWADVKQRR
jgi:internalin A